MTKCSCIDWRAVDAVQKRIDCLTDESLARSCVPAERDEAGLLDRDPLPAARLPDDARADRGLPRPESRLAVPFTRGPADPAADVGVDGARL